jgi:cysteine desulfurase
LRRETAYVAQAPPTEYPTIDSIPKSEIVYLDHAATTALDPRVLEAMLPFLREDFGNAASRQHEFGRRAADAVARAREQVAALIGADPRELIFTSGATEANNLALKGIAHAPAYERRAKRMLSVGTEHRAILDPLRSLKDDSDFELDWLAIDAEGVVNTQSLIQGLDRQPLLASVMHANNEIGVIQDIAAIGAACREREVLFHTDATQAVGKLPIDVDSMNIDALSLSAHKFYGPKGVGALYLRRRRPRVRCRALHDGGGHEGGVRSGTLNVPGIVGLGAAAEICTTELDAESRRLSLLRDKFETRALRGIEGVSVNGSRAQRLPGITNLSFAKTDAESVLRRFQGVAASSSSACTSAVLQASHVLRALGLDDDRIDGSIRFSLGRWTTSEQIDRAFDELRSVIDTERREGPSSC